jgi:hypothetical protein
MVLNATFNTVWKFKIQQYTIYIYMFIQKDEEEIESWVQAIIDNQEAYSSKWENILLYPHS